MVGIKKKKLFIKLESEEEEEEEEAEKADLIGAEVDGPDGHDDDDNDDEGEDTRNDNSRQRGDDDDRVADDDDDDMPPPVPYLKLFRFSKPIECTMTAIALLLTLPVALAAATSFVFYGRIIKSMIAHKSRSIVQRCLNGTLVNVTREEMLALSNGTVRIELIDDEKLVDEIRIFIAASIAIGLVQLACGYVVIVCTNASANRQMYRIRRLFLSSILRQDVAWYDAHSTGEFASRTADDLEKLRDGIGEKLGLFSFLIISSAFFFANAFWHGWELTLVMLCVMPIIIVIMVIMSKLQSIFSVREMKAYANAGSVAEEVFAAIKTVAAFGGESKEMDRYKDNLKESQKIAIQKHLIGSTASALIWLLLYVSYALAFWYGIKLILEDREKTTPKYDAASFIVVFMNVLSGSVHLGYGLGYIDTFAQASAAGATIFNIIDRIPYIDSLSSRGLRPNHVDGCIRVDNVVFEYPNRANVRVLDGLDLKVETGETLALIGESGCGKSTVIQLMQRFYDPSSGIIKLDNCDIKLVNVGWLREHIGVVSQEPVLFGTTIAENIRNGLDEATQEDIERAAKMANAHDFIVKLPKKYETQVGDRGTQLSGGQKQRVAIARVLIKNPKILLFDEATSALDSESERIIQDALDKARRGRTTIIIAHRLSTIRNADQIAVLSAGRVAEIGTHDQLMSKRGVYHQMVTSQVGENGTEKAEEDIEAATLDAKAVDDGCDKATPNGSPLAKIQFRSMNGSTSLFKGKLRKSRTSPEDVDVEDVDDDYDGATDGDVHVTSTALKLLKYNEPEWCYNLLGCIGSLLLAFNVPVYTLIFGQAVGLLADCDSDNLRRYSMKYAGYFVAHGCLIGTSAFLQIFMFSSAGQYLTNRLRKMLFNSMVTQDMKYFDDEANSVGAMCTRLSGDMASVKSAAGEGIGHVLQNLFTLLVILSVSFLLSWKMALVSLLFMLLQLAIGYMNVRVFVKQTGLDQESLDNANKIAIEAISNIRTVASLHREPIICEQYMKMLEKAHHNWIRNSHVRGICFGFDKSLPTFANAVCMMYGGHLIINESVSFEKVVVIIQLLIFNTMKMSDTFTYSQNFTRGLMAAKRIFDQIELRPSIDPMTTDGRTPEEDRPSRIQFKRVKFAYENRAAAPILRDFDLTIPDGKIVALVGSSGCGKSTCIQLLERFYDPTSGCVTIDDKDISELNAKWLRSRIGIVSQEPILFDRTIAENIAYGSNSERPAMQDIVRAAITANAHKFISALPRGYDTRVGNKGLQLSGGQKQRIAIARALVRNPKILLLDEATSALDSENEKLVQEAIEGAQKGRTCIVVAHRLSTIKDADLIAVIHKGKVVELGSHDQLIELDGHYRKYYDIQKIGET